MVQATTARSPHTHIQTRVHKWQIGDLIVCANNVCANNWILCALGCALGCARLFVRVRARVEEERGCRADRHGGATVPWERAKQLLLIARLRFALFYSGFWSF